MDSEEYLTGVEAVAVALGNRLGLPMAVWVVGFAAAMDGRRIPAIVDATIDSAAKLRTAVDGGS